MLHLEAKNGADVVDEILEGTTILSSRLAEALLDEVPSVPYIVNLTLQVISESLTSSVLAGAIVERADEVETSREYGMGWVM